MTLTSRKSRPLDRSAPYLGDTRLIIIATEGRETEKQYFAQFSSTRMQVKILPTGNDNCSSPEHVLARLKSFRQEFDLDGDDELWLMIDVDRWGDAKLSAIAREANCCGFSMAVSNPCFETWLLFHFADILESDPCCNDIETLLRTQLGGSYNKSNLNWDAYKLNISAAIERAKKNDTHPGSRWPQSVGSRVYKVIENIPM